MTERKAIKEKLVKLELPKEFHAKVFVCPWRAAEIWKLYEQEFALTSIFPSIFWKKRIIQKWADDCNIGPFILLGENIFFFKFLINDRLLKIPDG